MTANRQKLFDYWKEIPSFIFKEIPKEKYFSHPVRREIIRLFKEGLKEGSPDGKFIVRHTLNVREISNKLEKSNGKSLGKTALYFHLDILTELGLIKEIATLHEGPHGRNLTKYYGRVARNLILSNVDEEHGNIKQQFEEFRKFAKILGLELPKDYSSKTEKINDLKQNYYRILGKWLVDYENIIEKEKLNLNLLFDFLKNVNAIHPNYIVLFENLFKLLRKNIEGL